MESKNITVTLAPINKGNWEDCVALEVGPTQCGFILPNVNSLAELAVTPEAHALGVYWNNEMVGFAMFQKDEDGIYDIHRFMTDFSSQGKGIGLAAIKELIAYISRLPDSGNRIKIMFLVENMSAERLYLKAGFVDSGETVYNEKWRFTEKVFYYDIN